MVYFSLFFQVWYYFCELIFLLGSINYEKNKDLPSDHKSVNTEKKIRINVGLNIFCSFLHIRAGNTKYDLIVIHDLPFLDRLL